MISGVASVEQSSPIISRYAKSVRCSSTLSIAFAINFSWLYVIKLTSTSGVSSGGLLGGQGSIDCFSEKILVMEGMFDTAGHAAGLYHQPPDYENLAAICAPFSTTIRISPPTIEI